MDDGAAGLANSFTRSSSGGFDSHIVYMVNKNASNQSGGSISSSSIYGPWQMPDKVVTKVTVTKEYDEKGNLVKEVTVTETTSGTYVSPDTYITYNTYNSTKCK